MFWFPKIGISEPYISLLILKVLACIARQAWFMFFTMSDSWKSNLEIRSASPTSVQYIMLPITELIWVGKICICVFSSFKIKSKSNENSHVIQGTLYSITGHEEHTFSILHLLNFQKNNIKIFMKCIGDSKEERYVY